MLGAQPEGSRAHLECVECKGPAGLVVPEEDHLGVTPRPVTDSPQGGADVEAREVVQAGHLIWRSGAWGA